MGEKDRFKLIQGGNEEGPSEKIEADHSKAYLNFRAVLKMLINRNSDGTSDEVIDVELRDQLPRIQAEIIGILGISSRSRAILDSDRKSRANALISLIAQGSNQPLTRAEQKMIQNDVRLYFRVK